MTDSKEAPSNEECTQMYHRANGITAKHPPITSAFIFEAMRYAFAEGQKAAASRMQAEIRALTELAHHLRGCVDCGETDVLHCSVGRELWQDAIEQGEAK